MNPKSTILKMFRPSKLAAVLACFAAAGLHAHAATFYWGGGATDIADNTTIPTTWSSLNGTWDGTIKNFANSPGSPNTYQAWADGNAFSGTFGGYTSGTFTPETSIITLGANVSLPTLNVGVVNPGTASNTGNKGVAINASSAKTITLSGSAPVIDVRAAVGSGSFNGINGSLNGLTINSSGTNVSLVGSNGFSKTGNYFFKVLGTNDALTGTVNVTHNATMDNGNSAGSLIIGANGGNGTLAGVTRFNVTASGITGSGAATGTGTLAYGSRTDLIVQNNNASLNQLNDSAVINLGGVGVFQYKGRTSATETVGSLRLGSSGILDLSTALSGTGALAFTNGIDRANNRAQLMVGMNASGAMTSTVNLGTSHGLGTNVLLPWATDATKGRFLQVDGSNNLVVVTPTDVTNVSTITNSATDYRITGDSTQLTGTTFASGAAANSLGFYRGTNANPVTVTVTDTLTIASGGLVVGNDNNNAALTITGGTSLTTSGNKPLYISTAYSSSGGSVVINTPITGDIDVVKTGANDLKFGGSAANTYTGTTYVNGGSLTLGKSASVTSVAGNAVVRTGGTLVLGASEQIANTATVTVENGAYFNTTGYNETIANLSGGGVVLANNASASNVTATVTGAVTIGDGGIGTMINNRFNSSTGLSRFQMNSGAVFNFELSASGGTSDEMDFYNYGAGEFLLNTNAINLTLSGTQAPGTYTVSLFKFYSDNGVTLTSSGIASGSLSIGTVGSGFDGTPTLNYNSGGNSIDLTYTVVPEPSTWALLAFSLTAMVVLRRRRTV